MPTVRITPPSMRVSAAMRLARPSAEVPATCQPWANSLARTSGLRAISLSRPERRATTGAGMERGAAAAVVGGYFARLALRDFDVKAVHLVELHAQVGNAGAQLFTAFKFQQKTVAIGLDGAQLVQVGIAAVVDDAAVADQRSRLVEDALRQQLGATGRRLQILENSGQKWRLRNTHGRKQLCFL